MHTDTHTHAHTHTGVATGRNTMREPLPLMTLNKHKTAPWANKVDILCLLHASLAASWAAKDLALVACFSSCIMGSQRPCACCMLQ
jgi:hypothetical protein